MTPQLGFQSLGSSDYLIILVAKDVRRIVVEGSVITDFPADDPHRAHFQQRLLLEANTAPLLWIRRYFQMRGRIFQHTAEFAPDVTVRAPHI